MKKSAEITTATAQKVLEHHFGKKPTHLQQIAGGESNFAFEAAVAREEFILRISNKATRLQYFMKEQWAVKKARSKRVPAPEILEVSNNVIGLPYMIARKVTGTIATSRADDLEVFDQMGKYAAAINSIRTSDFGNIFDWSPNELSRRHSWKEFLVDDFKAQERIETFAKHRILRPENLKELKAAVKDLAELKGAPSLSHGDLRLKNILLDGKGKITAIIDWEHATSNLAPYWELAIALHDLGIDQKEAFLRGYGIGPKELEGLSPAITALNILHYARFVRKAFKNKDSKRLAQLRQRLNGALDLHSL